MKDFHSIGQKAKTFLDTVANKTQQILPHVKEFLPEKVSSTAEKASNWWLSNDKKINNSLEKTKKLSNTVQATGDNLRDRFK